MDYAQLKWISVCPNGEAIHFARIYASESKHWLLHNHDFYECFFISEGSGTQQYKDEKINLSPGELYFITPSQVHGFQGNPNNPLSFYNIAIKSSIVLSFIDRHSFPLEIWNENNYEPIKVILTESNKESFVNLVSEAEKGYRSELDADFFLTGLLRILRTPNFISIDDEMPFWLREALHIAASPDNLRKGVKKLTEICHRSQEHMARTFKKHMGITPTTWINKLRINHAKYLLVSSRMSISEIELECGFESSSHFHSLFRKETGETPNNFRNRSSRIQIGVN